MFFTIAIIEVVAILTGVFCLRQKGPVILYLILLISILAFINENILVVNARKWWNLGGNIFYNVFSLIEICTWFFIYFKIFNRYPATKLIVVVSWLAVVAYSLTELFIIHSPREFHAASYLSFSAVSFVLSIVYFVKADKKEYYDPAQDSTFWICSAAICFNCIFFINLFTMMDQAYWSQKAARQIFHVLQSIAIIIYYLLICIAFIVFYYRLRKTTTRAL